MIKTATQLKKYCKHIMGVYCTVNPNAESSGMYFKLKQFQEEGRIKDLIGVKAKVETKVGMLNIFRDKIINEYCKPHNISVDIKTFDHFTNG